MIEIPKKEDLLIEFKSDQKSLPDRELAAAVVALANTDGGKLYLGVEDDGTVTGLHSNHTNTQGLAAVVANHTNPSLSVRVEIMEIQGLQVARIDVPKSRQLVSTSEGLLQRRRLMANGTPEAIPFYPHEFPQRQSSLGLIDISAMPCPEAKLQDLNPLERQRLRQMVARYGGDQALLSLADDELDRVLGMTIDVDGEQQPTMTGMLLLGKEEGLRRLVPTHEVAFQVLEGTDVRQNTFYHSPLLQTFESVLQHFETKIEEEELQVGLFRVPVPNFEKRAFREAFVNALIHRDYARLGAVHVRLEDNYLTISNPGGFVEGVNLDNLLVVEPKPRNPLLADVIKRIGLAERTGRGIDLIYTGLLRFGRPVPDYSRSDSTSVVLRMSNVAADIDFLKIIIQEEERSQRPMPLDSLIVLARLRTERRLTNADLTHSTQKSEGETRAAIEALVEAGLIEAHGSGRGRSYTLSARIYRKTGKKAAYVRQAGFDVIQQEQMVMQFIAKHGRIKRADVIELCQLTGPQAYRLLQRLTTAGKIIQKGRKRHTFYEESA